MRQYCRYCAECAYGDEAYCSVFRRTLSDAYIKHTNHCKSFQYVPIDVIDPTQRYKPRKKNRPGFRENPRLDQISIFEVMQYEQQE